MITQLATVKARLALDPNDPQYDTLLTSAIRAASARFDRETHRTLARTENFTQEFDADTTEIIATCYPIESVTKFELKANETDGWLEQTGVQFLVRRSCIISLPAPLIYQPSTINYPLPPNNYPLARVTYTAGYVLPGATPAPGQTPLPDDLEQAAVEQVAAWFLNRDTLGLKTIWVHEGDYRQFLPSDLLLEVRAVLKRFERWSL